MLSQSTRPSFWFCEGASHVSPLQLHLRPEQRGKSLPRPNVTPFGFAIGTVFSDANSTAVQCCGNV